MNWYLSFRKTVSLLLCVALVAGFTACSHQSTSSAPESTSSTSTTSQTQSSDNARVKLDLEKTYAPTGEGQRMLSGSFVQTWYCSGWGEGRWRAEMQSMVDNGLTYLVVPCAADRDTNTGAIHTYFPTSVENATCSTPTLDMLFQICDEYGIKVIMAPFGDGNWYSNEFGWKEHSSVDDSYGQWMKNYGETSNKLAKEIYDLYKAKYPETFYGWYFSDELWNMSIICEGSGHNREVALDILALGFNTVLDFYTQLDPSMPLLLSPFCNRSYSTAEQYMNMWIDLFARVRFRKGDIFCPQDSIGGHPQEIKVLDEWTRAYRQAADTKPELRFWMNNENFAGEYHATIDRLKQQIDITARYCEANITFSWQHHYSPYLEKGVAGYSQTYHDFYVNGVLESEAPTAPNITVDKDDTNGWTIHYTGATDNIGIAGFYIYRNTETNLLTTVRVGSNSMPNRYITQIAGTYYVQAFDFAGNKSPLAKVVLE